jgi:transcriptional regulator with XRE-family HTH domain
MPSPIDTLERFSVWSNSLAAAVKASSDEPGRGRECQVDVGKRVRERRLRRGLVIEELARKTGLSKAYISQIETGKASPSLRTAERLAQALEVPLTYLFLEDALSCQVIRKAERQRVSFGAPDKLVDVLSAPNRNLELVLLEIPAGYTAGGRTHSHEGEECHWVLEGRITAIQGDRRFEVTDGDSFHWDGSIPHRIENHGGRPARLLVARTPPGFLNATVYETRVHGAPDDTPVRSRSTRRVR